MRTPQTREELVTLVREIVDEVQASLDVGTAKSFHVRGKIHTLQIAHSRSPVFTFALPREIDALKWRWEEWLRYLQYARCPRKDNRTAELEALRLRCAVDAQCEKVLHIAEATEEAVRR